MSIKKYKTILAGVLFIVLGLGFTWTGVSFTQQSPDTMRDVMRLLFKARQENKFYGIVRMEIYNPDSLQVYIKKVWANFPDHYREEFIEKPADPMILRWLQRRQFFFSFRQDMRFPEFAPHPPFPERMPEPDMGADNALPLDFGMRLLRNFEPDVIVGDSLLQRPTYAVTLIPRIPFRPQMQLWVDKEHGTILRFKVLRQDGKDWVPRYIEYFTSIDYNPHFDSTIFVADSNQTVIAHRKFMMARRPKNVEELPGIEDIQRHVKITVIIPSKIPEGFSLERIRLVHGERGEVLHLHYSDGVYAFSIFQSEGVVPPPFGDLLRQKHPEPNEIVDFSQDDRTVLFKLIPPLNLVVVGNCQESLLRSVLESLKR